jgi:hypothetical protein
MAHKLASATFGKITVEGATKSEAKARLNECLLWLACQSTHVEVYMGHTIVIAPTAHGWEQRILAPGAKSTGCMCCGRVDAMAMIFGARMSVAQNMWQASGNDAAYLASIGDTLDGRRRAELSRWVAFQREHARLTAAGVSPNDAHRMACDHSHRAA